MAKQRPYETKRYRKPDGTIVWLFDGKLHNWDEPAVVHTNDKKEYWLYGFQYTKEEWMDRKRDTNGIPPAKDPKYDTRL